MEWPADPTIRRSEVFSSGSVASASCKNYWRQNNATSWALTATNVVAPGKSSATATHPVHVDTPRTALLHGIKPAITAIVAHSLWGLGRTALKSVPLAVVVVAVLALYLVGVNPIALRFGGSILVILIEAALRQAGSLGALALVLPCGLTVAVSLVALFHKFGAVVYDSGYVLLAFLRDGLVASLGWLAHRPPADLRYRRGPVHPRPGLYYGHFHRLPGGRVAGGAAGDAGQIPALFPCRGGRLPVGAAPARLALNRRLPRRRQRGGGGPDGRRDHATGPGGAGGRGHRRHRPGGPGAGHPLLGEIRLASPRRGGGGSDGQIPWCGGVAA